MADAPTVSAETEPDEAVKAEFDDHPGADTLTVPSFDEAGFLRWSHVELEDEAS